MLDFCRKVVALMLLLTALCAIGSWVEYPEQTSLWSALALAVLCVWGACQAAGGDCDV